MYVLIGGGGLVGRSLAQRLVEAKHDVVVIDSNRGVCEDIYGSIGALTALGSATDIDVLEDAGAKKADVAVATMRSDADNLAFALLSRQFDIPRIFARMRNPKYEDAYKSAGVTRVMNLVQSFTQRFFLEIERPELRIVAEMQRGRAAVALVRVGDGSHADGKTVAELTAAEGFPQQCAIAGIYRKKDDEFIVPRGQALFHVGDQVFLAADAGHLTTAAKFLAGQK